MPKQSGLGWTTFSVDDAVPSAQVIKNDVTNLDFSTPYDEQDITGLDKYAHERLALLADFTGSFTAVFNPDANKVHAVCSGDLRVVRTMSLAIGGKSLANEVLLKEYKLTRAANGAFTANVPFALADGTVPTWA